MIKEDVFSEVGWHVHRVYVEHVPDPRYPPLSLLSLRLVPRTDMGMQDEYKGMVTLTRHIPGESFFESGGSRRRGPYPRVH